MTRRRPTFMDALFMRTPAFNPRNTPRPKATRVVVIDHRKGRKGRILDAANCDYSLHYQDDGRTLKLFINDPPTP